MASRDVVGKATYQTEVDPSGLKKGLSDAERQIKSTGAAAEQAFGKQATGALGKLDAALKKISAKNGMTGAILGGVGIGAGIGVFSLVTQGLGMVTDALGDATAAAKEDELSQAKLRTALEANVEAWDGNTDAIEATIAARMKLGFADDEQRDSLAQLVAVTKDATTALDLQRTAMDLARLRNMSLADASALLGKVYSGNVGILSRYGIKLEKGASATEALAEVQRRAGGQAKAWADKNRAAIADIRIGEAMESIGASLTPLIEDMTTFAADVITNVISGLGNLGDAFDDVRRSISPIQAAIDDTNAEILKQAAAMGLNADAALAYAEATRQQAEAERTAQENRDTFEGFARTALGLFGELNEAQQAQVDAWIAARLAEEGLTFTVEENTAAVEANADAQARAQAALAGLQTAAADVTKAWMDLNAEATFGSKAWQEQNRLMADNADLLNAVFQTLPPELQTAMREAGLVVDQGAAEIEDGFDRVGGAAKDVVPTIKADLSPLTGIVKGSLRRAKAAAEKEGAEFRWAMEHPLAGDKLGAFWEKQIRVHQRRRQRAIDAGNATVIAREDAFIADYKARLTALRTAKFTVAVQTVFTGTLPNWIPGLPGLPGRAAGGPVQAMRPYIVGEHRPELFVPDRNGTILPSVPQSMSGRIEVVVRDPDGGLARSGISTGALASQLGDVLRAADRSAGARYTGPR
jgi:hypothetical protein